jgi:parallel beta-helix repeat protein
MVTWGIGLVLLLMLVPPPAWATFYWVSPAGNNGNACSAIDSTSASTDPGTYRQSIGSGSGCLAPGDTLMVKSGTYNEAPSFPGGTGESTRKIYQAQNQLGVIVQPGGNYTITSSWITIQGFVFNGADISISTDASNGLHVRLQNGEVRNAPSSCIFGGGGSPQYLELINMHVHHCGLADQCNPAHPTFTGECHGIYISSHNNLIDGGNWHDCSNLYGGYCLHLYSGGWSHSTVRNVTIHDNVGPACGSFYGTNNDYYNNVFYNNRGGFIVNDSNSRYFNNTISGNNVSGGGNVGFSMSGGSSNQFRNNIIYGNNGGSHEGSVSGTSSDNLCNSINTLCTDQGNPGFISTAGGNFRIATAGSPAVGAGQNLYSFGITTDADGLPRPPINPFTIGAYEFAAQAQPGPLGLVQWLKCNGNTNDSSPNAFNGTGNGGVLTNGAPIVDGTSCVFDGVNDSITSPNTPAFRPPQFGMAIWVNTTTAPAADAPCRMMSIGSTAVLGWNDAGMPFCFVNNDATITGTSSILTGLNELIGCSYDGTNVRLWRSNAGSSAPLSVGQALSYGGSEVLTIGGVSGRFCQVRADNSRFFDLPFSTQDWQNIFNEVVPSGGVSTAHMRYYADAAEGSPLAAVDTDLSVLPGLIVGMRFGIRNSGPAITEYFPLWCSRNDPTMATPSKVTNSFASLGLRITTSAFVSMGQATTVPLPSPNGMPLDTFTPVPGQFVADTINPSLQKVVGPGQHREDEYRVETGFPATGGDTFTCAPRRESDAVFDTYNQIKTLTLQSIAAPSALRLGGTTQGGVSQ